MEKHISKRDNEKTEATGTMEKHNQTFKARQPPSFHLLDFILSSLTSDTDNLRREVTALILANLPHDVGLVFSDAFREKRGAVKALQASFLSSLASSNSDV
ncbi:hypothetical protein Fmac_023936 [Flemingia macrophylla]|uniref:Uncharacterized protein n=1 Tax=Flemingia macrophylla TaxID=520843 RepID=A0ABD1LN32_9FABA